MQAEVKAANDKADKAQTHVARMQETLKDATATASDALSKASKSMFVRVCICVDCFVRAAPLSKASTHVCVFASELSVCCVCRYHSERCSEQGNVHACV